jgi:SAM-dependent methyltransferase
MFQDHYIEWRESRMNTIKKYISSDYFKDKKILELGCGYADIGNEFYKLGASVSSSDIRTEHIDVVNQRYPHIRTLLIDGDNDDISEKYDIIIHWGLLYHLNEIEKHLEKVSDKCDVLLLETEVADSDNPSFYIKTEENGPDQAFNFVGIRPSPSYVERILKQNGFQYKMIIDSILNANIHRYDWEIHNTNTWHHGLRRFWICWKNVESPLL